MKRKRFLSRFAINKTVIVRTMGSASKNNKKSLSWGVTKTRIM